MHAFHTIRSSKTFIVIFLLLFGSTAGAQQLQVGVAQSDITPVARIDNMTMMGGKSVIVDKVHDPLKTKVLVLKNDDITMAWVSIELIAFPMDAIEEIRSRIADDLGIRNTFVSLTHTHGSGRPSEAVTRKIIESTIETAREAQQNLSPAKIAYARGEVNESYNRRVVKQDVSVEMLWNNSERVPSYPVDNEVGVISILNLEDDSCLATLVNYNAHPVISMNFEELIVSADYPGAMAQKVEAEQGGVCFFFLGAAGDINAWDADMLRKATPEQAFQAIDRLAGVLAREVIRVSENIKMDSFTDQCAFGFQVLDLPMALRKDGPQAERTLDIEVDCILIGESLSLVTIPGELFVELGFDLKQRSPADATWLVTVTNGSYAYIPTLHATCEGGYGATSGTLLEVGAGERMMLEALVSIHQQMALIKPLD